MSMIQPENARAVLAAGCLLGGMQEFCAFAYDVCRHSLSVETIDRWLQFVEAAPSSNDGATSPELPQTSIFGLYAQKLRDDVFHFLVTLPETLEVAPPQQASSSANGTPSPRDLLLQAYSRVPFDLFKSAVESPTFRIGKSSSLFNLMHVYLTRIIRLTDEILRQALTRLGLNSLKTRLNCVNAGFHGVQVLKRQWYLRSEEPIMVVALCISHANCASGHCGKSTPRLARK